MKPLSFQRLSTSGRTPLPRRAVTVIELLVVVATIAIVALLTMPLLSAIRTSSSLAHCTGNLRTLSVAVQSYIQDHQGVIPHGSSESPATATVIGALGPYVGLSRLHSDRNVKTPFQCPAAERKTPMSYYMNYECNMFLSKQPPVRITAVRSPAIKPFMFDSIYGTYGLDFTFRHKGGMNILFMDGHVGWQTHAPAEFRP